MKSSEQQLDEVFHAIPEWVRQLYPDKSLAERVKLGFEYQQKTWTETYLAETKDHEKVKAFLLFLVKTHGLDFSEEYWKFLVNKDLQNAGESKNNR